MMRPVGLLAAACTTILACSTPPDVSTRSTGSVARSTAAPEPPADPARAGAGDTCVVSSVGDGDSFRCAPDGRRVRLLLIDAPEMAQQPWGDSARLALLEWIPPGTRLRLEYDVQRTDRFDRVLAHAWLGDRLVNEAMARGGYVVALVYPPNVKYVERIRAAVEDAQAARRGLWSGTAFVCRPVDFRARRCR